MTGRRPQHATPSSGDSSTPTDVLALSRAFCFFLAPRPRRHATDRASPAPTHAMDPARAPPQGLPRSTAPSASARPWMDLPLLPRSSKERWPPLYIAGGAHSCRAHGMHPFKGLAADHEGQLGAPLCPCRRLTIFPWQSPPLQQGLADHKDQLGACFGISHEREAILTMHLQQRLPCHTQTQPAEQPCQLGGQVAGQVEGGEEGQREAGGAFCDEQTKTLWFFKRIGRREGAGFICRVEMMLPVLPCYLCWFYVSSRDGVRQ